MASIICAGTARLIAMVFKGRGRYEDIFCILSISLTFPMFFTMWIPETIYFLLAPEKPFCMFRFDKLRQVVGIIWPLVLCVAGISISEKIRWHYNSIIITAAAAIPMTALMIIFIR